MANKVKCFTFVVHLISTYVLCVESVCVCVRVFVWLTSRFSRKEWTNPANVTQHATHTGTLWSFNQIKPDSTKYSEYVCVCVCMGGFKEKEKLENVRIQSIPNTYDVWTMNQRGRVFIHFFSPFYHFYSIGFRIIQLYSFLSSSGILRRGL